MKSNVVAMRLNDSGPIARKPGRLSKLGQEVEDHTGQAVSFQDVVPNNDPVLRFIAPLAGEKYSDERVYSNMERTESKTLDARRHLSTEIFGHGFEILPGESGSSGAQLLHDFATEMWNRIPSRLTMMKRMLDAYFYGWAPLQVIVDTEATFQGRSVWMPKRIVNKPHDKVRFLRDGGLVWAPWSVSNQGRIFTEQERHLGWLTPRVGCLDHEYGRGLHSDAFLLVWAKKQLFRKFQTGVDRQMGMPKASKSSLNGKTVDAALKDVQAELAAILDQLNSSNILVEAGGWKLDFITDLSFISGGLEALTYLDERIMTLYCGEILTSNPGDRGTQALGTVHRSVKTDYAKELSQECIEEPITELMHAYAAANFGEIDPADMPTLANRMHLQVNAEHVRLLFDMGAPIDARRLSDRMGVAALLPDDPTNPDPEAIILTKQPAPQPTNLPANNQGGDPHADDNEQDEDVDKRTRAQQLRQENAQNAGLDSALSSALQRVDQPLRSYTDQLALNFLDSNGLSLPPKAPASE